MIVTATEAARLRHMTEALLAGSTLAPGGVIQSGENRTGHTLLMPGVNSRERSVYPGFWTRDPAWIAEAGLVAPEVVWGWIKLLCATMNGPVERRMTTGAVVPPFAVPDHVTLDGQPIFFPASEPGDAQGGGNKGMCTEHDNQYWLNFTASVYAKLSGEQNAGARLVSAPFSGSQTPFGNPSAPATPLPKNPGETEFRRQARSQTEFGNERLGALPLWLACDLAHHALETDPATGCCFIRADRRQADWGYSESATKSGNVVFPTLLRLESCRRLAELLDGCGQAGRASALRAEEQQLRRSVVEQFVARLGDQTWLLSATGEGRVPDVWASAFAVHRGFLPGDVATAVARTLADGIRRGTTTMDGQIVHVPKDHGGVWPKSIFKPGKYQNGAGWGYPVGWYVSAVAKVDTQAARQLFTDYLAAMERGWRDDGVGCAWECVNPALDHFQNEGYLTTVALPYVALREAGLLGGRDQ